MKVLSADFIDYYIQSALSIDYHAMNTKIGTKINLRYTVELHQISRSFSVVLFIVALLALYALFGSKPFSF